nr:hypothetical protein [Cryobacterium sp. MLB-32]
MERGVTNINLPEAGVKTLMLAAAARTVVVADGSKLGQVHLGLIGMLGDFDTLVTDIGADPAALAALRDTGLTVLQPANAAIN